MAHKKKLKQAFHCDGFYFGSVCQYRGEPDPADVRYRGEKMLEPRPICKSNGLDKDLRLCKHCVENKKWFAPNLKKMRLSAPNGRIVSLTPFQAKSSDTKTIRAFSNAKDLAEFLKLHPDLYGVDVNSGNLVGVEVE